MNDINTKMNDFIEEYKKCLKIRQKTMEHNQKIKKKVRNTHIIIALFFLCVVYFYYKPQYVCGMYGEYLENKIQEEYNSLVSSGWKDIHEIHSYLEEYREKKRHSYLVWGDHIYRADEIVGLLSQSRYRFLIVPLSHIVTASYSLFNRAYMTFTSIFVVLNDSGNGVFSIEHIGNLIANGIWVISLHTMYWAYIQVRNKSSSSPRYMYMTESPRENSWILIRDGDFSHVVTLGDMIYTINHPLKREEIPRFYRWFLEEHTLLHDT